MDKYLVHLQQYTCKHIGMICAKTEYIGYWHREYEYFRKSLIHKRSILKYAESGKISKYLLFNIIILETLKFKMTFMMAISSVQHYFIRAR